MGGQACILYGAAEFSRDVDLAVVATPKNMQQITTALEVLGASTVAVPPFEPEYLERGHAVHFRCERADVSGLRIDIMTRMRGVDPFDLLWGRRTSVELPGEHGGALDIDVLSLPDLVLAKKTQRDKDWPMIRRLVEANYFQFRDEATAARVQFWLREMRTPRLLVECVRTFPEAAAAVAAEREAVAAAADGDVQRVEACLAEEQARERELDRAYWTPLRAELERLRREQRGGGQ